ncbi:MAG: hypothetical protein ABEJ79_08470 [Halolamina sp.]
MYRRQLSAGLPHADVTAAVEVDDPERLQRPDPTDVERFATEADRMADEHDPDDAV